MKTLAVKNNRGGCLDAKSMQESALKAKNLLQESIMGNRKLGKKDIPLIMRGLTCFESQVRANAIVALAKTDAPGKAETIIHMLETDDDWFVKVTAAEALGRMKEKGAFDTLIKALRERNYQVRVAAVEALGDIGDRGAVPALERILACEKSPENPNPAATEAWQVIRAARDALRKIMLSQKAME